MTVIIKNNTIKPIVIINPILIYVDCLELLPVSRTISEVNCVAGRAMLSSLVNMLRA